MPSRALLILCLVLPLASGCTSDELYTALGNSALAVARSACNASGDCGVGCAPGERVTHPGLSCAPGRR